MLYIPGYTKIIEGVPHTRNYVGGEIISPEIYCYGIYECRARFATQNGSWPAFWLFGGDDISCNNGGGYRNEIDIAEQSAFYTGDRMGHTIHWYYPDENCLGQSAQEDSEKYGWSGYYWHIYKLVWTPTSIRYYIDDNLRHTVVNNGQKWTYLTNFNS